MNHRVFWNIQPTLAPPTALAPVKVVVPAGPAVAATLAVRRIPVAVAALDVANVVVDAGY